MKKTAELIISSTVFLLSTSGQDDLMPTYILEDFCNLPFFDLMASSIKS